MSEEKLRVSKKTMCDIYDHVMLNLHVLVLKNDIELFFGELYVLVDEEIERAVLEDRQKRSYTSEN
jgi:hypothetical protein